MMIQHCQAALVPRHGKGIQGVENNGAPIFLALGSVTLRAKTRRGFGSRLSRRRAEPGPQGTPHVLFDMTHTSRSAD